MQRNSNINNENKNYIINVLVSKGSFWSYSMKQSKIDDNSLIEKALLYLDFEDMERLFMCYSKRRIKEIWKHRLLSQGDYYAKINWLLAVLFFDIKRPDKYLKQHGQHR